jgi:hypothetical protein
MSTINTQLRKRKQQLEKMNINPSTNVNMSNQIRKQLVSEIEQLQSQNAHIEQIDPMLEELIEKIKLDESIQIDTITLPELKKKIQHYKQTYKGYIDDPNCQVPQTPNTTTPPQNETAVFTTCLQQFRNSSGPIANNACNISPRLANSTLNDLNEVERLKNIINKPLEIRENRKGTNAAKNAALRKLIKLINKLRRLGVSDDILGTIPEVSPNSLNNTNTQRRARQLGLPLSKIAENIFSTKINENLKKFKAFLENKKKGLSAPGPTAPASKPNNSKATTAPPKVSRPKSRSKKKSTPQLTRTPHQLTPAQQRARARQDAAREGRRQAQEKAKKK